MAAIAPDPDAPHHIDSEPRVPRWVKIFGLVALALLMVFAIVHLAMGGFHGHGPR